MHRNCFWLLCICLLLGLTACNHDEDGTQQEPPEENPPPENEPPPEDNSNQPLVSRGGTYLGFSEKFNRYYTDPDWQPSRTIYVSRTGSNTDFSNTSYTDPAAPQAALDQAQPGDLIYFLRDDTAYPACYEMYPDGGGTYDQPVVLYGERDDDGTLGVTLQCCTTDRNACINLERTNYVAIDGFEMIGGDYGVRAVGPYNATYTGDEHQVGVAVLNNIGHDQNNDPFFSGTSNWVVWEGNTGYGAGTGDGHGIYISNGSDWNIIRFNNLYDNHSSDFQINADPISMCDGFDIPYTDDRCDGSAANGQGRGVSEFMYVSGNYFHNGRGQGSNFTSVRNSVVKRNIIGLYDRHGTSFWQETNNPALGSSNNIIQDNLFLGTTDGEHVIMFIQYSTDNEVSGNIFGGLTINGGTAFENANVILILMDDTTDNDANNLHDNYYLSGHFVQFDPQTDGSGAFVTDQFMANWFTDFPFDKMGEPANYTPTELAPAEEFGGWMPHYAESP